MSAETDVVSLAIASVVGFGGVIVGYLGLRGNRSEWAGSIKTDVAYCKKAIDKLADGLPKQLSNIERRVQLVEDVCPEVAKHRMAKPIDGDCESGDELGPKAECGPKGTTGNDCGSEGQDAI